MLVTSPAGVWEKSDTSRERGEGRAADCTVYAVRSSVPRTVGSKEGIRGDKHRTCRRPSARHYAFAKY